MKVGDKVTHIDYPRDIGLVSRVIPKYKGYPPIILVRWENASMCSRHIPSALKRVN